MLALANALKVEPGDLIGELELPPNGGAPLDLPRGIPALRRTVCVDRYPDREAPAADKLRADTVRAKDLNANGHYEAVAIVLPDLLVAARTAVAQEVPGAWWCLAGPTRQRQVLL